MSLLNLSAGEVVGLADALRELDQINPTLKRELLDELRTAGNRVIPPVQQFIPTDPPLSGFRRRSRLGWRNPRNRVRVRVRTRANRSGQIPLLTVSQTDPVGALFDMAGRRTAGRTATGRKLVEKLTERNGTPSRSMWRGAETAAPEVEQIISDVVDRLDLTLGRR